MSFLFMPAVRLMRRLPMVQKFGLVCLSFLLPVMYLLVTTMNDRQQALAFARQERVGLSHFDEVEHLLSSAAQLRGALIDSIATGQPVDPAGVDTAEKKLEAALGTLEALLKGNGDPLKLAPPLAEVRKALDKLKALKGHKAEQIGDLIDKANEAVAEVVKLMDTLAGASSLALDPDADSYYLMLVTLDAGPRAREALGRARSIGGAIAQIGDAEKIDPDLMMAMHNSDALADEYLERIQTALEHLAEANPEVGKRVPSHVPHEAQEKFITQIDKNFPFRGPIGVQRDAWRATGQQHIEGIETLLVHGQKELFAIIDARVARLQREFWMALGLSLLGVGLGAYALVGYYLASRSTYDALGRRLSQLSAGDLRAADRLEGGDELVTASHQLGDAVSGLNQLVAAVREDAQEIASSASQIAAANQELSDRGVQMAAVVEQTSASTSTLEETVGHNLHSAREADSLVRSAAELATRGGTVVEQAVRAMDEITARSRKIGDIIQVIDSIAFQTNILALNAAVEAARAGEQGRGFAVVAGEVRSLAQRSAEAAREIKTLIQGSIEAVDQGGQHVAEAGKTMQDAVAAIGRVTGIMGDITQQSQSQADQIRQLVAAIREVDRSTQQNAAMVEETAATASGLQDRASELSMAANRFKV